MNNDYLCYFVVLVLFVVPSLQLLASSVRFFFRSKKKTANFFFFFLCLRELCLFAQTFEFRLQIRSFAQTQMFVYDFLLFLAMLGKKKKI